MAIGGLGPEALARNRFHLAVFGPTKRNSRAGRVLARCISKDFVFLFVFGKKGAPDFLRLDPRICEIWGPSFGHLFGDPPFLAVCFFG